MKFTVAGVGTATVTVTNSDTTGTDALTTGTPDGTYVQNGATASGVTTFAWKATGATDEPQTVVIAGTYYTRTLTYNATTDASKITAFALGTDKTVLK